MPARLGLAGMESGGRLCEPPLASPRIVSLSSESGLGGSAG